LKVALRKEGCLIGKLAVTAPAKVNLALSVLGRRPDGYHELWTLMETISLADQVALSSAAGGTVSLRVTGRPVPTGEENLVVRAANLLRKRAAVTGAVDVHLDKVIPIGAGLGGGSSDAAATLVGLSELWNLELAEDELMALGAEVGSDVPFFVAMQLRGGGGAAVCTGRGEQVEFVKGAGVHWYILVVPREGVSTTAAYRALELPIDLTAVPEDAKKTREAFERGDVEGLRKCSRNDLQRVALSLSAGCGKVFGRMVSAGLPQAMVSGSGSALFCLCGSRAEAEGYANRLAQYQESEGFEVLVATGGPGGTARPGAREAEAGG
jgi:4-diphosphocytidyl-2-C-methyl-D-erythritol kinase